MKKRNCIIHIRNPRSSGLIEREFVWINEENDKPKKTQINGKCHNAGSADVKIKKSTTVESLFKN
jgi:hypothetical protein